MNGFFLTQSRIWCVPEISCSDFIITFDPEKSAEKWKSGQNRQFRGSTKKRKI